ncbi:hypothetical protein KIPB_004692, partial [Kipferlia bialata]
GWGVMLIVGVTSRMFISNTVSVIIHTIINVIFTSRAYHFIFHLCNRDTRQSHKYLYVMATTYVVLTLCDMIGKFTVEYHSTQVGGFFGTFVNVMRACIILNRLFQIGGELFFFHGVVYTDLLMTGSTSEVTESSEETPAVCTRAVSAPSDTLHTNADSALTDDMPQPIQRTESTPHSVVMSLIRDCMEGEGQEAGSSTESLEDPLEPLGYREPTRSEVVSWQRERSIHYSSKYPDNPMYSVDCIQSTTSEAISPEEIMPLNEAQIQALMVKRRRFNALYNLYFVLLALVFLARCIVVQTIYNALTDAPTFLQHCHVVWTILIVNSVMLVILSAMNPMVVSRGIPETLGDLFAIEHGHSLFMGYLKKRGAKDRSVIALEFVQECQRYRLDCAQKQDREDLVDITRMAYTIYALYLHSETGHPPVLSVSEAALHQTRSNLTDMFMPRGRWLDLRGNALGDQGMKVLCTALRSLSFLRKLDLGDNGIGCEGMKFVAYALDATTQLTHLALGENPFLYLGLKRLVGALYNLPSLAVLRLEGVDMFEQGSLLFSAYVKRTPTLSEVVVSGSRLVSLTAPAMGLDATGMEDVTAEIANPTVRISRDSICVVAVPPMGQPAVDIPEPELREIRGHLDPSLSNTIIQMMQHPTHGNDANGTTVVIHGNQCRLSDVTPSSQNPRYVCVPVGSSSNDVLALLSDVASVNAILIWKEAKLKKLQSRLSGLVSAVGKAIGWGHLPVPVCALDPQRHLLVEELPTLESLFPYPCETSDIRCIWGDMDPSLVSGIRDVLRWPFLIPGFRVPGTTIILHGRDCQMPSDGPYAHSPPYLLIGVPSSLGDITARVRDVGPINSILLLKDGKCKFQRMLPGILSAILGGMEETQLTVPVVAYDPKEHVYIRPLTQICEQYAEAVPSPAEVSEVVRADDPVPAVPIPQKKGAGKRAKEAKKAKKARKEAVESGADASTEQPTHSVAPVREQTGLAPWAKPIPRREFYNQAPTAKTSEVQTLTMSCVPGGTYSISPGVVLPRPLFVTIYPLAARDVLSVTDQMEEGKAKITFRPTHPVNVEAIVTLRGNMQGKGGGKCEKDESTNTIILSLSLLSEDEVSRLAAPVLPYLKAEDRLGDERRRKKHRVSAPGGQDAPPSLPLTLGAGGEDLGERRFVHLPKSLDWPPQTIRDIYNRVPGAHSVRPLALRVEAVEAEGDSQGDMFPCLTDTVASPIGEELAGIYTARLRLGVYLERLQQEDDIRLYDDPDTTPIKCGDISYGQGAMYMFKDLKALEEGRPSVTVGDLVGFLPHQSDTEYIGRVEEVLLDSVKVAFDSGLRSVLGRLRFMAQSGPFLRMHQAINMAEKYDIVRRLCPVYDPDVHDRRATEADVTGGTVHAELDGKSGLNMRQTCAIAGVLAAGGGDADDDRPYLIFGPPGTGKTTTIIALACVLLNRGHRILVCAPSNAASDLLAERMLVAMPKLKLARIMAYTRKLDTLSAQLQKCVPQDTDGHPGVPTDVDRFDCVVCTCSMAVSLPRGSGFTHVLVDEAGSGLETDVLCALQAEPDAVYVLAGDPRQLGPVVTNSINQNQLGYGVSAMDRLIADPAMKGSWTMLNENYRNHPAILRPSSTMFYGGDLIARAGPRSLSLCRSPSLPCSGFPLSFTGVMGRNVREGCSPSWCNPEEVSVAVATTLSILRRDGVDPSEIAVVTPYRLQATKIRQALKREGVTDISVGSVEVMQGREFDAVVISTVRACDARSISNDIRHVLGFVSHPRRLNVSITRARALVAIIGNAEALCIDPHWRALLQYIKRHGGATGVCSAIPSEGEGVTPETDRVQRSVVNLVKTSRHERARGKGKCSGGESEQARALLNDTVKVTEE